MELKFFTKPIIPDVSLLTQSDYIIFIYYRKSVL